MIGLDLETIGELPEYALQSHRVTKGQARIRAISISNGAKSMGLLDPTTTQLKSIINQLMGKHVVCWNTPFDVSWLEASGVDVSGIKWLDAMLIWMHLVRTPESDNGPRKSYALKAALDEYFPDEAGFKDFEDFQTDTPEGLEKLLHRNKEDARFTVKLSNLFWSQLSDKQRQAALIEAKCIPMVASTFNRGLRIDVEALKALREKLEADGAEAYRALKAHYPEIDSVNLGSPKQIGELLYSRWGLTPPKMTDKGAASTDKFALHSLAETYPQAKLLRDYRESQNNIAKYVVAKEEALIYNGDGYVRPQAKIFGTYTGRMTYYSKQGKGKSERATGIALHQEKRGSDFRNTITPPPGYSLIELDFAGQEFGLMAVASGDRKMLELREPGEDAHSFMGAQVTKQDYKSLMQKVKEGDKRAQYDRKLGKFCNLSFQYRIGAKAATVKAKVEYGLDLDERFVQGILNTYKTSYPGVPMYWINSINNGRVNNYAETFAGRRINLKGNWLDQRESWALESTAINYPIQGTGGDQKYLALAVARNFLPSMGGYFYYELHDGLFFILPEKTALKDGLRLKHLLSNLPYKAAWGWEPGISFPVDLKIGPSWGQLKEVV